MYIYLIVELAVEAFGIRTIHTCRLWVQILLRHRRVQSLEDWQHGPGRSDTLKNHTKCRWRWEPDRNLLIQATSTFMCCHIYNWNIIGFDVKQPIKKPTSLIVTRYNSLHMFLNYKTKVQLLRDRFKWLNKSPRKSIGGVVYRFVFEVVWCNEHHLRGYFETNKLIYLF